MKTQIKIVAMKLAVLGLTLAALAAPARAGQALPNGLNSLNGISSINGLNSLNGLCPSSVPCSSSSVTTFIAIWTASGIDPSKPLATAIATRK